MSNTDIKYIQYKHFLLIRHKYFEPVLSLVWHIPSIQECIDSLNEEYYLNWIIVNNSEVSNITMKIILLFLAVLFESHGLPTSFNSDNNLVFNATRNVKR